MVSGYTDCACRDCFDIAVSDDVTRPGLCGDCETAGCEPNAGECQRDDAYGAGSGDYESTAGRPMRVRCSAGHVFDDADPGDQRLCCPECGSGALYAVELIGGAA